MRGMSADAHCVKSYRTQQVVRVTQECFVARPEDGEARFSQLPIAQGIFDLSNAMHSAVKFDYELELGTQEVRD